MRLCAIVLATLAFLFRIEAARSEPLTKAMTWDACVEEAKRYNPDLVSAMEVIAQAKANRSIKASPLFPQVNASMSDRRAGGSGLDTTNAHSMRLSGEQLFFDGFKTVFNVGKADDETVAARYNYVVTSSDVRLNLRTAFAELLSAQEYLNITRDIEKRRRQNADLVKLRYEAGREHRGALLLAQADLAQAEYDMEQAERAILLGQRRLNKQIGHTHLIPVFAKGTFDVVDRCSKRPDFEAMADGNPFLQKLIALTDAARYGLRAAKADFFPRVFGNIQAGKAALDNWPPNKNEWSLGIDVGYPLFTGRSRISEVYRTRAALNQAVADEKSGRDGVILTLEQTWTSLQNALDVVGVQRKFLVAGQERAKIGRAQYSIGIINFDDWTILEDNLVRAQKSFLSAELASLVAEADWIQAKGGTLESEPVSPRP
jgi:outer membrane protein TolC